MTALTANTLPSTKESLMDDKGESLDFDSTSESADPNSKEFAIGRVGVESLVTYDPHARAIDEAQEELRKVMDDLKNPAAVHTDFSGPFDNPLSLNQLNVV